jgi:hypothetical protein
VISLNNIFSPMNGLVAGLLRSPLHFIASKGLLVIHWSGRSSGRAFSIPVGYQPDGDAVIVMISKPAEKNWWKNFRSPWPAELTVRGTKRSTIGEVVPPGTPEFFAACERTLQRLPWMGSQFGGVEYNRDTGLSEKDRTVLARHVGAVRFEYADQGAKQE